MKIVRQLILLVMFFPVLVIGKDEVSFDSVLASVNGEPISLMDVVLESGREEARLASIYSGKELYQKIHQCRKQVVDEIIDRKLVYSDYENDPNHFKLPKQYVENMLDQLANIYSDGSREGLKREARKMGLSMKNLEKQAREKVIVDIMINENCDRVVYITPREVYEYFQQHQNEFGRNTQIQLQLLLLKNEGRYEERVAETAMEIRKRLHQLGSKSFVQLVKIYSEGPNIKSGGAVGWLDESKLRKEFAEAVKGIEIGEVVGPVRTDEGYYFLRLAGKRAAEEKTFKETEKYIRKKLAQKAKREAYRKYIDGLKKKAFIRYYF